MDSQNEVWAAEFVERIVRISKNEASLVVIRALKELATRANDRFVKVVDLLDVAEAIALSLVDDNGGAQ